MSALTRREYLGELGAVIVLCTVVLVTCFVGVLAIVSGEHAGIGDRVPWYVVGGAIGFVLAIVALEIDAADGPRVMAAAAVAGVVAFVVVTLVAEGLRFAIRSPEEVFATQLLLYLLAAALVATGIGYWLLHHWDEIGPAS